MSGWVMNERGVGVWYCERVSDCLADCLPTVPACLPACSPDVCSSCGCALYIIGYQTFNGTKHVVYRDQGEQNAKLGAWEGGLQLVSTSIHDTGAYALLVV
jgi:hypothetical protein